MHVWIVEEKKGVEWWPMHVWPMPFFDTRREAHEKLYGLRLQVPGKYRVSKYERRKK